MSLRGDQGVEIKISLCVDKDLVWVCINTTMPAKWAGFEANLCGGCAAPALSHKLPYRAEHGVKCTAAEPPPPLVIRI